MEWTEDKKTHYIFCYNFTKRFPKYLRYLALIFVFVGGIIKEIKDYITPGRCCELNDIKANLTGSLDALNNNENKFSRIQ